MLILNRLPAVMAYLAIAYAVALPIADVNGIDTRSMTLDKRNDYCKNNRGKKGSYKIQAPRGTVVALDSDPGRMLHGEFTAKITHECTTDQLPSTVFTADSYDAAGKRTHNIQCRVTGIPWAVPFFMTMGAGTYATTKEPAGLDVRCWGNPI